MSRESVTSAQRGVLVAVACLFFLSGSAGSPRIKYPAFTGFHVRLLIATMKRYLWICNYRYVNPDACIPVIVEIDMLRDLGTGTKFH